jgi:glycosyltransferase involved in cell wall biosynthesis
MTAMMERAARRRGGAKVLPAEVAGAAAPADGAAPPLRVLMVSHSHPLMSKGGAEIAAHKLFTALAGLPGWQAWFLGCQRDGMREHVGSVFVQPWGEREYLYAPGEFEWLRFANRDVRFPGAFRELLAELRPDVVHFHHFARLGVESFYHVRQVLPRAAIVLTLHEFLAICYHYGQMVTKGAERLCERAEFSRCHDCFPDIDPTDFFLRKVYIERFFAEVDQFVCPSQFLAGRFAAWGLPRERLAVVENVISEPLTPPLPVPNGPLRVGFFGQISRLKGIDVLFDAADLLLKQGEENVVIDVFGDYRSQPPEYQEAVLKRLATAGRNVHFHGAYEPERVDALMQQVEVTVVPSIWWENSPVVIQEAFRNRRPVICSDIGGMAEKVRDGIDGWHFRAGDAVALAARLAGLAASREEVRRMAASVRKPLPEASVATHVALYRAVLQRHGEDKVTANKASHVG